MMRASIFSLFAICIAFGLAKEVVAKDEEGGNSITQEKQGSSQPEYEKSDIKLKFIRQQIPNASEAGAGTLEVFIWNFYAAYLYAPDGVFNRSQPHALRFDYLRAFNGEELAETFINQMRRHQKTDELRLAAWYNRLSEFVPDVDRGDSLMIVISPKDETAFYLQQRQDNQSNHGTIRRIGMIRGRVFARCFSDLWLGENVEHPGLRAQLLGHKP